MLQDLIAVLEELAIDEETGGGGGCGGGPFTRNPREVDLSATDTSAHHVLITQRVHCRVFHLSASPCIGHSPQPRSLATRPGRSKANS